MFVLDSHCDTPSQILRLRDLNTDSDHAQVDFPKLERGGVNASFFALYTPNSMSVDHATRHALRMIAGVRDAVKASQGKAALATKASQALSNSRKGVFSVFLGMENGLPVGDSLSVLRLFYDLGVRYLTLTHNGDNLIADSAAGNATHGGLSPFGREVVEEMNRLGMIIDIAHSADSTFWDCIGQSSAPIVSTHSCCRALCPHRRNLTDEMIRALADKGGVIQINFYPRFLSEEFDRRFSADPLSDEAEKAEEAFIGDPSNAEYRKRWNTAQDAMNAYPRPGVKEIVDHIDHAVKVGGIGSVGIGSDFDGIEITPLGMEDVSKMPLVFQEMERRGYSPSQIEKVAGRNFLRVVRDVCG